MSVVRLRVVVDWATVYGREVLRGASAYARQRGEWSIRAGSIQNYNPPGPDDADVGTVIQAMTPDVSRHLASLGKPAVNVGDATWPHELPCVISDHVEIGRLGAEHFLQRGYRHLAFYGAPGIGSGGQPQHFARQRWLGFSQTARSAGVEASLHWGVDARDNDPELTRWILSLPTPLGLMAAYDGLARHVVEICIHNRRRVPDHVAVLGVDNDEVVCEMAEVPVSSVAIAAQRIGYEAAALVDQLIQGRDRDARVLEIPPLSVVTRISTDHLAVSDPLVAAAIRFIRSRADQPINVEDVAGAVHVSRRNLEQRFHQSLRRTPAAEIRRAHIERACNLLETTDTPLGQVALLSGLSDGPSLSRFFKREMGLNPSQYRSRRRLGV